jgi:hypothetical protein
MAPDVRPCDPAQGQPAETSTAAGRPFGEHAETRPRLVSGIEVQGGRSGVAVSGDVRQQRVLDADGRNGGGRRSIRQVRRLAAMRAAAALDRDLRRRLRTQSICGNERNAVRCSPGGLMGQIVAARRLGLTRNPHQQQHRAQRHCPAQQRRLMSDSLCNRDDHLQPFYDSMPLPATSSFVLSFLPCLQPALQGGLAFTGRLAAEQVFDADVFIQSGPVNSATAAD